MEDLYHQLGCSCSSGDVLGSQYLVILQNYAENHYQRVLVVVLNGPIMLGAWFWSNIVSIEKSVVSLGWLLLSGGRAGI